MPKILVVRKPDRTIHQVPLENKAMLQGLSNKLPMAERYRFEEMDEKEATKLGYYDNDFISADNAKDKVASAEKEIQEKDKMLAELQAKLDALTTKDTETASEKIERIIAAENALEVSGILGSDTRKTVIDAAQKRFASFGAE